VSYHSATLNKRHSDCQISTYCRYITIIRLQRQSVSQTIINQSMKTRLQLPTLPSDVTMPQLNDQQPSPVQTIAAVHH